MNAFGPQTAAARLQSRRRQIVRELARVERKIVRAQGQVRVLQERIALLTPSQRRAA